MKLEAIQVVRGLAACMVAMCHIYNDGFIPGSIVDFGGFGVDLFFVISGFIMCLTIKVDAESLFKNALNFLKKRVVRIFPLYLFCAIPLIVYVSFRTGQQSWYYYLGNILLLPSFTNDKNYSLALPPGWTLVYEMLFYYLFTISLLFFSNKYKLFVFVFGVIVASVFFVNYFDLIGPRLSWVNFTFIIGHLQILNFGLGIIVYFIFINFRDKVRLTIRQWIIPFIIISLLLVILIYLKQRIGIVEIFSAFVIILLTTITKNDFSQTYLGRIFLKLGDASYSIYLLHFYFAFFKLKVYYFVSIFIKNNVIALNLVDLVMLIGAIYGGVLLHRYVEQPLTKKCTLIVFKNRI